MGLFKFFLNQDPTLKEIIRVKDMISDMNAKKKKANKEWSAEERKMVEEATSWLRINEDKASKS
jgi:hypothetical protein